VNRCSCRKRSSLLLLQKTEQHVPSMYADAAWSWVFFSLLRRVQGWVCRTAALPCMHVPRQLLAAGSSIIDFVRAILPLPAGGMPRRPTSHLTVTMRWSYVGPVPPREASLVRADFSASGASSLPSTFWVSSCPPRLPGGAAGSAHFPQELALSARPSHRPCPTATSRAHPAPSEA